MGTARTCLGLTPTSGSASGRTPVRASYSTSVEPPTVSSAPNFMKSSQLSATATSRMPPGFRTSVVATRTRHEDSPPRIWEPKLLVMIAWYPSAAAAAINDSPAETMPSPPEPAMPNTRSVLIAALRFRPPHPREGMASLQDAL